MTPPNLLLNPPLDLVRIEDLTRREFMFGALGAALLAACGSNDDDDEGTEDLGEPDATTRIVQHETGETEIPQRPQRMVTLWRPTLAAVTQLGLKPIGSVGDEATAGADLAPFLPEDFDVEDLSLVGPQNDADLEKIAALQPDLIIGALTSAGSERDLYPQLSAIAPTVLVEWLGTTSWRQQLIDVAEILDLRTKADELVEAYEQRAAEVRDAIDGSVEDMTVSLVRIQAPGVLRMETPLSFPGQVIGDIGFGRPESQITPDPDRDFIEISLERIREVDADVIFVFHNAGNTQAWQEIQDNPLWQGLEAQSNGRVFTFEYEWWGNANYFGAHRILDDVQATLST